jgi:hypothetical protein
MSAPSTRPLAWISMQGGARWGNGQNRKRSMISSGTWAMGSCLALAPLQGSAILNSQSSKGTVNKPWVKFERNHNLKMMI